MESGLSRASIVWPLGELKTAKATEQLATRYLDALQDETLLDPAHILDAAC